MEKLDSGKYGIMILIVELEWKGWEILGFCNLKRVLLTTEGLKPLSRAMSFRL